MDKIDSIKNERKLIPLGDGIWSIDEGMVRCFFIVGKEKALLVDTGAAGGDLLGLLRPLTQLPITVVNTHGDRDHTACNNQFDTVCAHPNEFDVILNKFHSNAAFSLIPVEEGFCFHLGGRTLEVLECFGHTPGSICLLDRENRLLFSGDFLSCGPVFMFGQYRSIAQYLSTLMRYDAMSGELDIIYPCHNTCPVDAGIIKELIACTKATLSGELTGVSPNMPMLEGENAVKLYSLGRCSLLY